MKNQIQQISLYQIAINPNNPRKSYSQENLAELAESIKTQGVLQPIMLHPKDEEMFEIVYGERRCRAAALAGLETIPAIVNENLTEIQIAEIALIENMQREDIKPLEEYHAFNHLIEKCGYDVELLMARFSKSESYIQSRLKLRDLYSLFRDLLVSEEINLTLAFELCKYSEDTQAEIYNAHYETTNSYHNWKGESAKSVIEKLSRDYSTKLDEYFFDKTECYKCNFNTDRVSLFTECASCGRCTNRECLSKKNVDYIVERAVKSNEQNPELPLAHAKYSYSEKAVEELTAKGYEVEMIEYIRRCPVAPIEPIREDYDTDEDYEEAILEYNADCEDYTEKSQEITERYQAGEIKIYATIDTKGVSLCYITISSNSSESSQTPIEKLQSQDSRFKEIAIEKTIEDTKKLVNGLDVTQGDYSLFEEQIIYFAQAKQLRQENFAKVGIDPDKHYLTDCDRWDLVQRLTDEIKTIIKRDFIVNTLRDAQRANYTAVMLYGYAEQHANDRFNEIQESHNEVYNKRHARIEEKIERLKNNL
ncbi:MAG: ParB/RepB/Spo0J family partition protein [Rikenellaceae bacterium]